MEIMSPVTSETDSSHFRRPTAEVLQQPAASDQQPVNRGYPVRFPLAAEHWLLAAWTLRSEATPKGPLAPATIAHTAIIRISYSGYFLLRLILKSETSRSASFRVSGFLSSASACLSSVETSMKNSSFPHLT